LCIEGAPDLSFLVVTPFPSLRGVLDEAIQVRNMNICIFGDSITWGASDFEKSGWADRLKVYCLESLDVDVYNLGISGDTSEGILNRIEQEAKIREASGIIIAIGVNDSAFEKNGESRIDGDRFEKNVREISRIARDIAEFVIFVGIANVDEERVCPKTWGSERSYKNSTIEEYNEIVRRICKEEELEFIETKGMLSDDDLEDGLHPNNEGHRKIFEKIKEVLTSRICGNDKGEKKE